MIVPTPTMFLVIKTQSMSARRGLIENSAQRENKMPATSRKKAFTLVELLVVVAIIALLVSILLPALGQARAQARKVVCSSKLRQLQLCATCYVEDNRGKFPFQDARNKPSLGSRVQNALNRDSGTWQENWIYSLVNYGELPKQSYICQEIESLFKQDRNQAIDQNGYYLSYTANGVVTHFSGQNIMRTAEVVTFMDDVWLETSSIVRPFINTHSMTYRSTEASPSESEAGFSGWMRFADGDLISDGPHDMKRRIPRWTDDVGIDAMSSDGGNQGGKNYTFLDGHAEYLRWDEISSRRFGLLIDGKDQFEADVMGYNSPGRLGYIY